MTWIDIKEDKPMQIKMRCDWCSDEAWWINELLPLDSDGYWWHHIEMHTDKEITVKHICPKCYKRLLEPSVITRSD